MFSWFFKSTNRLSLILDVGDTSVGAALVYDTALSKPKILHQVRYPIVWETPPEPGAFLNGIQRTVQAVVKHMYTYGLEAARLHKIPSFHVQKVHAIYSSPWYLSQTKIFKIDRERPMWVTRKLVRDYIRTQEKHLIENTEGTNSGIYTRTTVIERKITNIKLNGYQTNKPYKKRANSLEIALQVSLLSQDIQDVTEQAIGQYFTGARISFATFPLVTVSTLHHLYDNLDNFLCVDIRGETTDVSFIRRGTLLENLSFPCGKSTLLRAISEQTNSSVHIASSLLHLADHKKALPNIGLSLQPALERVKSDWQKQFSQAINDMSRELPISSKIVLLADHDVAKYWSDIIKEQLPTSEIHIFRGHELRSEIKQVSGHHDPFLILETFFANRKVI